MRKIHLLVIFFLLCVGLSSCTPGHTGSNVVAFLRDGKLWTIDPNGANAFAIVDQSTSVVGYSWSPTHQILAFRTLDSDFAKTGTAKKLAAHPLTGLISDTATTMSTVGVDGGSAITTMFSDPHLRYSNPYWNTNGTRLIFRQSSLPPSETPEEAIWWIAQNDQPGGIAAKTIPSTSALPSPSYTRSLIAGSSTGQGIFTVAQTGGTLQYLLHKPLSGHPLPASLERILWQPAHQDKMLLYALADSSKGNFADLKVDLVLLATDGTTRTLTSCTCEQFAWSPTGNSILYSTASGYTVFSLADNSTFTIKAELGSIPYWSPDGQFLLLDGPHSLMMVQVATKQTSELLSDNTQAVSPSVPLPLPAAFLQPVANSLWAADSHHFVVLTRERLHWQGKTLSKGLYSIAVNNQGHPDGAPTLVDAGNDSQPGWTYQDPNTSFLY